MKHTLKTIEKETHVACPQCESWVATKHLEEGTFCDVCGDDLESQEKWVKWEKVEELKKELRQKQTAFHRKFGHCSSYWVNVDELLGEIK